MEELRHLDEVAYVRFASVYRSFQDVEAFREAIDGVAHHRRRERERPGGASNGCRSLPGESEVPRQGQAYERVARWPTNSTCAMHWGWRRLALTPPIPIRGWAVCWCAASRSWARDGTSARAARMPRCVHCSRPAPTRSGATAYVSLEPCAAHGRTPPCTTALLEAGVSRVVLRRGRSEPLQDAARRRGMAARGTGCRWRAVAVRGRKPAELNLGLSQPPRAPDPVGAGQAGRQLGRPHGPGQRRESLDYRPAGARRRTTVSRPQLGGAYAVRGTAARRTIRP